MSIPVKPDHDDLRWYAVHTHPKQEERADSNLRAWNVETFNPKIKRRRRTTFAQTPVFDTVALFPRYIFARFDAGRLLHKILFTRGVRSVVSFGDGPAVIGDEIIDFIKSRATPSGLIEINERFKEGDKVMVEDGPLKNLIGIFTREVKGSDRVLILIESIRYQGSLVIEREHLRRVETQRVSAHVKPKANGAEAA